MRQRFEPEPRIGAQFHAAPLQRVEDVHVEAHEPGLRRQRMRAGGEVLQPRSDRENDVGLVGKRVGRGRAGDADGAQLQRMVPGERALAGLGFRNRNAMRFHERAQRFARLSIEHAAASDDQRPLRFAQHRDRAGELGLHRRRRAEQHRRWRKEILWEVVRHGLHILRQSEGDRTAQRGIGQHPNRAWQRGQQLRGIRNTIEIA